MNYASQKNRPTTKTQQTTYQKGYDGSSYSATNSYPRVEAEKDLSENKAQGLHYIRQEFDQNLEEIKNRHFQEQPRGGGPGRSTDSGGNRNTSGNTSNPGTGPGLGPDRSVGRGKVTGVLLSKRDKEIHAGHGSRSSQATPFLALPVALQEPSQFDKPKVEPINKLILKKWKNMTVGGINSGMEIKGPMERHPLSHQYTPDGGCHCVGTEFLTTIKVNDVNVQGDILYNLPVSPLFFQGGRINSMNQLFSRYKVNSLIFEFIPSVPSSLAGAIGMEVSKDPVESSVTFPKGEGGLREFMSRDGSLMFQIFSYGRLPVQFNTGVLFTVNGEDARLTTLGLLNVFLAAPIVTDAGLVYKGGLGELLVHYDITFYDQAVSTSNPPLEDYVFQTSLVPILTAANQNAYTANTVFEIGMGGLVAYSSLTNLKPTQIALLTLFNPLLTKAALPSVGPVLVDSEGDVITLRTGTTVFGRVITQQAESGVAGQQVMVLFSNLQAAFTVNTEQALRVPNTTVINGSDYTTGTYTLGFVSSRVYVIENQGTYVN